MCRRTIPMSCWVGELKSQNHWTRSLLLSLSRFNLFTCHHFQLKLETRSLQTSPSTLSSQIKLNEKSSFTLMMFISKRARVKEQNYETLEVRTVVNQLKGVVMMVFQTRSQNNNWTPSTNASEKSSIKNILGHVCDDSFLCSTWNHHNNGHSVIKFGSFAGKNFSFLHFLSFYTRTSFYGRRGLRI